MAKRLYAAAPGEAGACLKESHPVPSRFTRFLVILLPLLVLLTGCSTSTEPITPETTGWFNHYFVYTFSWLIRHIAGWFGDSYGLSIVLLTVLIRLALMPFMFKTYRNQTRMQQVMKQLKPELQALKEKYKNRTSAEDKAAFQQETMKLYQTHNVNPLNMGCLPVLLQLPILLGFYHAIQRTPEIASHSFLWFNLGHTDLVLPILAMAVYWLQFKLSQRGTEPNEQQKQMAFLGILSPVMMGIFSFSAPAALPLYWTVGGCFLLFQTWLFKRLLPSKNELQAEALPG